MVRKLNLLMSLGLVLIVSGVADAQEKEPAVDYAIHPWREWTYASAERTIYGQFEDIVNKNEVVIFNRDGEKVSVPIYDLRDTDIFEALKNFEELQIGREQPGLGISFDAFDFEMTVDEPAEKVEPLLDTPEFELQPLSDESMTEKEMQELKEATEKARAELAAQQKAKVKAAEDRMRARVEATKKQAAEAPTEKEVDPLTEWNKMRTWTDVSGKHRFEGKLLKIVERTQVVLLGENGKETKIPLSKLSLEDMHVAVHGELLRPGGTQVDSFAISSDWIPGKNKR